MGKTIVLLILLSVFADKTVSFPGKSNSTDVFNCWHSRISTVKGKGDSLFECRSQTKTLTCAYPSELRCIHSGFFKCRKNKMDTNNQDETYNIRILCRSNKPHRLIASFSVEICKQNSKGQFQLSCSENIHSGRNITSNTKEHLDNASPSFKKFHDSRGGRFKRDVNDITASTNQVIGTSESPITSKRNMVSSSKPLLKTTRKVAPIYVTTNSEQITSETNSQKSNVSNDVHPDDKSSPTVSIVVGILVPVVILTIIGIAVYRWYRKKYPVRMIIGKNFSTHHNPVYTKKTNTLSLVRESRMDSMENGADEPDGLDNPGLDYAEMQPSTILTISGVTDTVTDLDDEPPVAKPRKKKQARISVTSTESVDSRVMSTFLQEALDEVDSEADDNSDSADRRKISVDINLKKNLSKVSVESEVSINSNDDENGAYENVEVFKKNDVKKEVLHEIESYDHKDDSLHDANDDDTYDDFEMGDRVEESGNTSDEFEMGGRVEECGNTSDEYDIVNVDESGENRSNVEKSFDDMVIIDNNNPPTNSQESQVSYENDVNSKDASLQNLLVSESSSSFETDQLVTTIEDVDVGLESHTDEPSNKVDIIITESQNKFDKTFDDKVNTIEQSDVHVDEVKPNTIKISYKEMKGDDSSLSSDSIESFSVIDGEKGTNVDTNLTSVGSEAKLTSDNETINDTSQMSTNISNNDSSDIEGQNFYKSSDFGNNDPFSNTTNLFNNDMQLFAPKDFGPNTNSSSEDFLASDPFANAETNTPVTSKFENEAVGERSPPLPEVPPPQIKTINVPSTLLDFSNDENEFATNDLSNEQAGKFDDIMPNDGYVLETPITGTDIKESLEQTIDDVKAVTYKEDTGSLEFDSDNNSIGNDVPPPPIPTMPPPPIQNIPSAVFSSITSESERVASTHTNQNQNVDFIKSNDEDEQEYDVLTDADLLRVSPEPETPPGYRENQVQGLNESDTSPELSLSDDSDSEPTVDKKFTTDIKGESHAVKEDNLKSIIRPSIQFSAAEPSGNEKTVIRPSVHFDDSDSDSSV